MKTHTIKINESIDSVCITNYGNLSILGKDCSELIATTLHEQDTTIVESNNILYVTSMSNCDITLPKELFISIEKGLGSVKIFNITGEIKIEKLPGSVFMENVHSVSIGRVGGNCSLHKVDQEAKIEKIGGNFIGENFQDLIIEKLGGNCLLKKSSGRVSIRKVGGDFSATEMTGEVFVEKVGGDLYSDRCSFGVVQNVGGDVTTALKGEVNSTTLRAGGDLKLYLPNDISDFSLSCLTNGDINIAAFGIDETFTDGIFQRTFGTPTNNIEVKAGGDIEILDTPWQETHQVSDFSLHFDNIDTRIDDTIHEQIKKATDMASKKVEEAQRNLSELQSKMNAKFEDLRNLNVTPPVPPVINLKKGATDEERLLILKMLQEKKITVDEAERLFRSLSK